MTRSMIVRSALLGVLLAGPALGQGDPEVLARIVEEGREHSQVWQHLVYLSEEIGPRLTGSSHLNEAHAWTRDTFASFGLSHAHLQKWGEIPVGFDRGRSVARMIEPVGRPFEFTARAWSAGTDGPVAGRVIRAPRSMKELQAMDSDDLKGAWVLQHGRRRGRGRRARGPEAEAAAAARRELEEALHAAGIAGIITGSRSDIVHTGAARGWRDLDYDNLPSHVTISVRRSDYDAMNSRLADGEEVVVEVDLQHHFVEGPIPLYNTIAEIPGTELPDEVVIISGHLDSWDGPGTQGAQDNGTGCSVALEAARILMAAGAKPKRTIRFILWSGEEQGLLGSSAYVRSLSDEELAGISAVFVEDGGTNYEGGLSCVEPMVPMLTAATAMVTEVFPDMPVVINARERMPRGGGSDHVPFNRAGVPGFFWAEHGVGGREGKNYRFIHHTQHDTVRYAIEEYLVQSAVCSAITAYNLACAETLLPRAVEELVSAEADEPEDTTPWKLVEGPVSGKWAGMLLGEEAPPDSDFTLEFEMHEDGRVRGTIDSMIGHDRLRGVTFEADAGTLKFTYVSEAFGKAVFEAQVAGEKITGVVTVEEQFSTRFNATRVNDEAEAAAGVQAGGEPEVVPVTSPADGPKADEKKDEKKKDAGDAPGV